MLEAKFAPAVRLPAAIPTPAAVAIAAPNAPSAAALRTLLAVVSRGGRNKIAVGQFFSRAVFCKVASALMTHGLPAVCRNAVSV